MTTALTYEHAINRLAAAGIVSGCAEGRYCPSGSVTREQMAAFLYRAFGPDAPMTPSRTSRTDRPLAFAMGAGLE